MITERHVVASATFCSRHCPDSQSKFRLFHIVILKLCHTLLLFCKNEKKKKNAPRFVIECSAFMFVMFKWVFFLYFMDWPVAGINIYYSCK